MANIEDLISRRQQEETALLEQIVEGIIRHARMVERKTKEDEQVSVTAFLSDGMQYPVLEIGHEFPIFLSLTVKSSDRADSESLTTILVPYMNVRFLFEKVKIKSGQQKVGFLGESTSL